MPLLQQYCSQSYPGIPEKKNKQPTYKNNNLLSFYEQQKCRVQKATWQHPPLRHIVLALQTSPLGMLVTGTGAGWALTAEPVLQRAAEI